jgi:hypothetical protein
MLPTYADIEVPLMRELARRGGSARPADRDSSGRSVYEALAEYFRLTPSDLAEVFYENGKPRSKWETMVRYAVRSLRKTGEIERGGAYGVWAITERANRRL